MTEAAGPTGREVDGFAAHFYDDLQTLDRLIERFGTPPSLRAFAQINLFTARAEMIWLVNSGYVAPAGCGLIPRTTDF